MNRPDAPRAVFILGCPRSGTSIFFKTLSEHPAICTTTNLTRRFMARFWMVRTAELVGARHRPVEAGKLWKSFWPKGDHQSTAEECTDENRRFLRQIVDGHARHFKKPVFLAKKPGLTMRVNWLAAGLPEARFIQLVRDGRATAASILRQCNKFDTRWSIKKAWPELKTMDYPTFSGALWTRLAVTGDEALQSLDPSRVLTVRYEEFAADPSAMFRRTADFCGFEWTAEDDARLPEIKNYNGRWNHQLDDDVIRRMYEQVLPGLRHFGYDTEQVAAVGALG